jgi:hypothetical protein
MRLRREALSSEDAVRMGVVYEEERACVDA